MNWLVDNLANYAAGKQSLGKTLRGKRIAPFREMIDDAHRRNGGVNILDIGGTRPYWSILDEAYLDEKRVSIALLNLPGGHKTTDEGRFRTVFGDACDLAAHVDLEHYDLIHSNSVIEHVGDWSRMQRFANSIKSFHGGYFVQTPSYWFPVEPHALMPFFHWLPRPMRVTLVSHFQLGNWRKAESMLDAVTIVESARLLDRRMFAALFDDAEIVVERMLGWGKSFVAVRQRKP